MGLHDQNFKNLILDFPRQALEFFAAVEARHIPPDAVITPLREELLKERLSDRFYEMDVPLLVEWKDGRREALVFCIEENSRADSTLPLRHAVYCIQLALALDTRRVVPVAIYPFEEKPASNSFKLSGDFGDYLDFKGLSITLHALEAAAHYESQNIVERLCVMLMKRAKDKEQEAVINAYNGLAALEKNDELQRKYIGFIGCYSALDPNEFSAVCAKIIAAPRFKENVMSSNEKFVAMGKAEGIAQGKAESIVALFHHGVIDAEQARHFLNELAAHQGVSNEIVEAAIKLVDEPKP